MTHATSEQLATYLGTTAPPDVTRLLARASELISDETVTAVYDVDGAGTPTSSAIVDGLRDATCAQVEYWLAGDEEDDILGPLQGMSSGTSQQQYGAGENRATPMYLAPRAARHLRIAGLLSSAVGTTGRYVW